MSNHEIEYTVLIADDDDGYRFPIAEMLRDFDYEVLEAKNVDEVKEHAKNAQIWVVDVRLPSKKLEGIEVVQELIEKQKIKPEFDIIFISVLGENDCKHKLDSFPKPYRWIEKPFELEYLLEIIYEMTGRT